MLMDEMELIDETSHREGPRILIVEDDADVALMLQDHLQYSLSAMVTVAEDAEKAVTMDSTSPAELVLIDYLLPDCNGPELVEKLAGPAHRPVIMMTGHATLGRAISAMRSGAVDMFVKPFDLEVLSQKVSAAIDRYRSQCHRVRRLEKVRKLSQQVIRDRRQLRRKLDVVCRDVVSAYQDLAVQVAAIKKD